MKIAVDIARLEYQTRTQTAWETNYQPRAAYTASREGPGKTSNPIRFVNIAITTNEFIELNENVTTKRKTLWHQKLFESFLVPKNEPRKMHGIPPAELNSVMREFVMKSTQERWDRLRDRL